MNDHSSQSARSAVTLKSQVAENVQPIAHQNLVLETLARLAQMVAQAAPGTRLPTEREICELIGVSRSTLREAVRILSFVGALQVRQGAGTFVARAGDSELEKLLAMGLVLERCSMTEVVEARRILEVQGVRLAAERREAEDLKNLEAALEQMEAAAEEPRVAAGYDLNYHILLAKASRNRVISHLLSGLRPLLEIWIGRAVNSPETVREILKEHRAVYEAVRDQEPERAEACMYLHQVAAAERLYRVVGGEHCTHEYLRTLLAGGAGWRRSV